MSRLFAFLTAIFVAVGVWGQPRVFFLHTVHDFGPIHESAGPVTCTFPLVNVGDEDLAIVSARAACGCTQPRYPRQSVAPGDTALIEVSFDPQGRPGRFSKQVYVETNALPSKARLDIKGVVIGDSTTVARRYPVNFGRLKMGAPGMMMGEVTKGRMKTAYFDSYNESDAPMSVTTVNAPKWLDVIVSPDTVGPGEQATFIAYVTSTKCPLYGVVEDSVTFSISGEYEITLPVTMNLTEDFSSITPEKMAKSPVAAVDSRVDFGEIDRSGGRVEAQFCISNSGQSNLEIRRVYSSDSGIEVTAPTTSSVKKGKRAAVKVTVDPEKCPGALLNSHVNVITNDPLHPVLTVRIVGIWKE